MKWKENLRTFPCHIFLAPQTFEKRIKEKFKLFCDSFSTRTFHCFTHPYSLLIISALFVHRINLSLFKQNLDIKLWTRSRFKLFLLRVKTHIFIEVNAWTISADCFMSQNVVENFINIIQPIASTVLNNCCLDFARSSKP